MRFPTSIISSSICLVVLATTSSIRAGWIRPSVTNLCKAKRAISLRTGSKQERMIASGVSSTMISTPVAASIALIFLPSRPMILPFTSSDSMLKTDTQFSTASSVPTLWMVLMIIFLASCCAVNLASSIVSWMCDIACVLASAFKPSISWFLASSVDKPAITSSCWRWLLCNLSTSDCFLSKVSILALYSIVFASKSSLIFLALDNSFEICDSLSRILFSTSAIFWSRDRITCSCSDFNSINFSFAWSILSFLMFSASRLASFKMEAASFFAFLIKLEMLLFSIILANPKPPAIPTIPEIIIVKMSIVVKIYI